MALKELKDEHSGENQALVLIKVIKDYGIASKLGYFMMDNATTNDTMILELSYCKYNYIFYNIILLIILVLDHQFQIQYDPKHHRLRCNGHILNLAANSFLFKTADEALADYNNTIIAISDLPSEKELEEWRKKGPLRKLYNLVVKI